MKSWIPTMRLNHINLVVSDPQASVEFYKRFLGGDSTTTWLGDSLHLRNSLSTDIAFQRGAPAKAMGSHHGFLAESAQVIDDLLVDLRSSEVTITDDCTEDGFRSVKFLDPDGYEIEVYWEADWP